TREPPRLSRQHRADRVLACAFLQYRGPALQRRRGENWDRWSSCRLRLRYDFPRLYGSSKSRVVGAGQAEDQLVVSKSHSIQWMRRGDETGSERGSESACRKQPFPAKKPWRR